MCPTAHLEPELRDAGGVREVLALHLLMEMEVKPMNKQSLKPQPLILRLTPIHDVMTSVAVDLQPHLLDLQAEQEFPR